MCNKGLIRFRGVFLALLLVATLVGTSSAAEYWLWADITTMTMQDGQIITVWGFGRDLNNDFTDANYTISVPGPVIEVPPGDTTLTIHLKNQLPDPASLNILGQTLSNNAGPVWTDGTTNTVVAVGSRGGNLTARVRSFAHEAAANGGEATYIWNNFKPGTYLLQSGTNPAKQVQMGLYAPVKKDAAVGQAYIGVPYTKELILVFHEIDPVIHAAVDADNYGPGADTATGGVTSSVGYAPKYFLINGKSFPNAGLNPIVGTSPLYVGENILLRFINAGLNTHVPQLMGFYMNLMAEDGNPYTYPKEQYGIELPAAKTIDAMLQLPSMPANIPLFDARLDLSNNGAKDLGGMLETGGMLAYIAAQPPPATGATMSANPVSPREVGGSITFTANGLGGTGSYEYRFWLQTGTTWQMVQDYSATNTWTWNTSGLNAGQYTVSVWVRSAGSAANYETGTGTIYTLVAGPVTPATGATISANPASPRLTGTTVTFTAMGSGGTGSFEYRYWLIGPSTGNTWQMVRDYSSTNTWTWTTFGLTAGQYAVSVWVRSATSASNFEAGTGLNYELTANVIPPATGATINATPPSPQPVGTSVNFTALGLGGSGNYEYRFWLMGPSTGNVWTMVQDYSTTPTWAWNTTGIGTGQYTISVWVRSANSGQNYETGNGLVYTLQ